MTLYLDYSATTPVHPNVLGAMHQYWCMDFGNSGSRTHEFGLRAAQAVELARKKISGVIEAQPEEIVFTSGATEANNIAILGLSKHSLNSKKRHIVSTSIEHKAVLEPLRELQSQGFEIELVPPEPNGRVLAANVANRVRADTLLVSMMNVNNETGVIQPLNELCDRLKDSEVFIHTDAAQGFGKDIDQLRNRRLDLISISAHKIFGPKGIGALMRRRRSSGWIPIKPIMFGGGQEKGLRPGTLPVPLIVGFGEAAELAIKEHSERKSVALKFRAEIAEAIKELPHRFNGDAEFAIPQVINLSLEDMDSEAVMVLVKDKIAISNGSACTSSSYKPSHVLKAMGLDDERIANSIRISCGIEDKFEGLREAFAEVRMMCKSRDLI